MGLSKIIVIISEREINKIYLHGEQKFPEECCGILIGQKKKEIIILEARAMRNINEGTRDRRYSIDPIDLMKIDREAEEKGYEILGIYHSHPNHPSHPSRFDLEFAWPNFSYFILSVENGKSKMITSWKLKPDRSDFFQEKVEIK